MWHDDELILINPCQERIPQNIGRIQIHVLTTFFFLFLSFLALNLNINIEYNKMAMQEVDLFCLTMLLIGLLFVVYYLNPNRQLSRNTILH